MSGCRWGFAGIHTIKHTACCHQRQAEIADQGCKVLLPEFDEDWTLYGPLEALQGMAYHAQLPLCRYCMLLRAYKPGGTQGSYAKLCGSKLTQAELAQRQPNLKRAQLCCKGTLNSDMTNEMQHLTTQPRQVLRSQRRRWAGSCGK